MRRAWLTPDVLPSGSVPRVIRIPDGEEWSAAFLGALLLLADVSNWEEFGAVTEEEAANAWVEALYDFVENGDIAMSIPAGAGMEFFGSILPGGWVWQDGAQYNEADYPALFAVIGHTYDTVSEAGKFNVPDKRGRVGVGLDEASPRTTPLGQVGGELEITLQVAEMPPHGHVQDAHNHTQDSHNHTQNAHNHGQDSHNHTQNAHNHTSTFAAAAAAGAGAFIITSFATGSQSVDNRVATNQAATATNQAATATNQAATATNQAATATNQQNGGGEAHNNMPPYLVCNFIIKV